MLSFVGEFTVPCTANEVYQLLMDPHRLAKCLPDLKRYEVQDEDNFSVTLRVGLGRVRGPMTVKLEIVEKRENSYARIKGKSTMLSSQVYIDGNFTLLPTADGGTLVKWTGNAKLGAYLMHVAGGLLEGLVSETIEQFVRTVKAEAMQGAFETGGKAGD
ncbi:MAG: SRPBCC domain-containing protein [Chloroflexota bacterium]